MFSHLLLGHNLSFCCKSLNFTRWGHLNLLLTEFEQGLPTVLPRLPPRVALHRVLPCLAKVSYILSEDLVLSQDCNTTLVISTGVCQSRHGSLCSSISTLYCTRSECLSMQILRLQYIKFPKFSRLAKQTMWNMCFQALSLWWSWWSLSKFSLFSCR